MADRSELFLNTGTGLLMLVGLLRCSAAATLLSGNTDVDLDIAADGTTIRIAALGMLAVGLVAIAAGIAAALRWMAAWKLGIAAAVAFVVVGFVANYVLFGSVQLPHTLINVVIAGVTIWCLSRGRQALQSAK